MTDPSVDSWPLLLRGKSVGEFTLGELISEGGFSYVFEAVNEAGVTRAAKVLRPNTDPKAAEEFHREARLLRKLRGSSNVVQLHDSGEINVDVEANGLTLSLPFSYHLMELAQGCLEEIVINRQVLTWEEKLRLWRGLTLGIHQMHLRQVVHRDLKSANCLLFVHKNRVTESKVADLGRSRDLSESPMHSRHAYLQGLGDFTFAPPEFLLLQGTDSSDSHISADLYGLGSVLYELATGQSITGVALGFGPEIINRFISAGLHQQNVDLASLRSAYTPALDVLRESLPNELRHDAVALVRQLCDPEPSGRRLRTASRQRSRGKEQSLEWLLRKADIMIRVATTAARPRRAVKQRRGA